MMAVMMAAWSVVHWEWWMGKQLAGVTAVLMEAVMVAWSVAR